MTEAEIDQLQPGPELDRLMMEKVIGWNYVLTLDDWLYGRIDYYDNGQGNVLQPGRHFADESIDHWRKMLKEKIGGKE